MTDRFRGIVDQFPAVIGILRGPDLILDVANPPLLRLAGGPEIVGRPLADLLPQAEEGDVEPYLELMRQVAETGEVTHGWEVPVRLPGREDRTYWDFVFVPVREADGTISGVALHAVDVSRLVEARSAAEDAGARTARLQEMTAELSASNSAEEIARIVLQHALRHLTASAGVLLRRNGHGVHVAHALGFPREDIRSWSEDPTTLPSPLDEALTTGATVVLDDPAALAKAAPGLGAAALIAVPLTAGDRFHGALGLTFREPRTFAWEDRDFMKVLARQAAAALDRAALFENRAYVARKLQEGLLPLRLAEIPGLDIASTYESISGGGEVGGDFYDVFPTGESRWAVAVGDVCGKGTEAAVITGLARHTLRAVARIEERPAAVLTFLNDALRGHGVGADFCTVGFGTIVPADGGGFDVRLSAGGHPFPLALRADGEIEEVWVGGTMLGVEDDPRFDDVTVHLRAGDALVLYTDGVTDARSPGGERFGPERLHAAMSGAAGGSAAMVAAAIEAAVRNHHPGTPADDRAVVVIRVA